MFSTVMQSWQEDFKSKDLQDYFLQHHPKHQTPQMLSINSFAFHYMDRL
jgi:hypothetical protein